MYYSSPNLLFELFKGVLDHKYKFYLLNYKVYEKMASLLLMKMCNSHDKDSSYRPLDAFLKFKLCKNLQLWNVNSARFMLAIVNQFLRLGMWEEDCKICKIHIGICRNSFLLKCGS